MRTIYNICHSLHQGFILPGFILLMFTNYNILCFKLLKPMLKTFCIKWVIKGKMSCQLVVYEIVILEVPQASLKSWSHSHGIETDFDMSGCEPGLTLMKRLRTTQK